MVIILILSTYLLHISNLEYVILGSKDKSIQNYYLAEGKIYRLLYQDKYYKNEVLPRIERYLRLGSLGTAYSPEIKLDGEDLIGGDNYGKVTMGFSVEEDRRLMVLDTKSNFQGITRAIRAKVYIIKDIYEMGIPVLYRDSIDEKILEDYLSYMDDIAKEVKLPTSDANLMGIESIDYDKIYMSRDFLKRNYIEFYRNNIEDPIVEQFFGKNIFLILKGPSNLFIENKDEEKLVLNGIIYSEGDILLKGDLEFNGILIINPGLIHISPDSVLDINGIVLSKNYPFASIEDENRTEIGYDISRIKTNGVYIPGFIDIKIKLIKGMV